MLNKYLFGLIIIIAIIGLGVFINAKPQTLPPDPSKLQVAASFYPLYFFAGEIGGDRAEVANITPAGAEPHDYEPTAQDIAHIEGSKILILSGDGFESWAKSIRENLVGSQTLIVETGAGLATQNFMVAGQEAVDPHVWLSPPLAQSMVSRILAGFTAADQTNAVYYQTNAAKLIKELHQLDAKYREGLSNCAQKDIVTAHAAFGYLAKAYGLNQVAIAGLSPDAEPSLQRLSQIAKMAKNAKIKYIFFESLVSPKLSETIASEIGAQTLVLNPIEGLTQDELAAGQNYLTKMTDNLRNLQIALSCSK